MSDERERGARLIREARERADNHVGAPWVYTTVHKLCDRLEAALEGERQLRKDNEAMRAIFEDLYDASKKMLLSEFHDYAYQQLRAIHDYEALGETEGD